MTFVVPTMLASTADYTTWSASTPPSNIDAILRSCTVLVLNATKMDLYAVDPTTGLPTDTTTVYALRDATCIQAQAWVRLSIDPSTGGVVESAKIAQSKKIGTASVQYAESEVQATVQARKSAYTELVPEALQYLRARGLAGFAPRAAWGPRLHPGWYWQ